MLGGYVLKYYLGRVRYTSLVILTKIIYTNETLINTKQLILSQQTRTHTYHQTLKKNSRLVNQSGGSSDTLRVRLTTRKVLSIRQLVKTSLGVSQFLKLGSV